MQPTKYTLFGFILWISLATGCGSASPTPFAATLPAVSGVSVQQTATPSDTPTPTLTYTPTLTPTNTYTPTPTDTPTITPSPTATWTPSRTPTLTPSNTPTPIPTATYANPADNPNYTPPPSWTPPPAQAGATLNSQFNLRRPISNNGTNWVDRIYPYGSTGGGRFRTHHGVEFQNPSGTPVLAAANGVVYYAGDDIGRIFGPQANYYGNVVVIQHGFASPQGETVYTLYGHLSRVDVTVGQPIASGDRIGVVGAAGVALGPHLHFEVRVGDPDCFCATRNPELWLQPYYGHGVLAGQVRDSNGSILRDVTIQVDVATGEAALSRYAYTYADDSVNSDPAYQETFTLGDLPANYYTLTVRADGRQRYQEIVYVYPNSATWVDIQLN
jgi:murein DD-endopeptidase MepM/ murein hydrolase activator NlpD